MSVVTAAKSSKHVAVKSTVKAKVVPSPKSSDVKCPGCAVALLRGGRCAAHGDPKAAHANGVAATGKERTLKGRNAAQIAAKASKAKVPAHVKKFVAEKKAAEPKAKPQPTAKGSRTEVHSLVIQVLAKENPRREGTHLFKLFAAMKTGQTVGEYLEASGAKMSNLRKCEKRGWVKLAPAAAKK